MGEYHSIELLSECDAERESSTAAHGTANFRGCESSLYRSTTFSGVVSPQRSTIVRGLSGGIPDRGNRAEAGHKLHCSSDPALAGPPRGAIAYQRGRRKRARQPVEVGFRVPDGRMRDQGDAEPVSSVSGSPYSNIWIRRG